MNFMLKILSEAWRMAHWVNPAGFMVLFSWAFLLNMLERSGLLMTPREMLLVFIVGSIILLLQYFIVKKIRSYCKHVNIYYGVIALLLAGNLFNFFLTTNKYYIHASFFQQMIIVLLVAGISFTIIKYHKKWMFLIMLLLAYSFFFCNRNVGAHGYY